MGDPKRVLCKYFMHGACKKGDGCPFSHNRNDRPNMACVFYQRGVCSYGSNCRYDHVKSTTSSRETSASQSKQPAGPPVILAVQPFRQQDHSLRRLEVQSGPSVSDHGGPANSVAGSPVNSFTGPVLCSSLPAAFGAMSLTSTHQTDGGAGSSSEMCSRPVDGASEALSHEAAKAQSCSEEGAKTSNSLPPASEDFAPAAWVNWKSDSALQSVAGRTWEHPQPGSSWYSGASTGAYVASPPSWQSQIAGAAVPYANLAYSGPNPSEFYYNAVPLGDGEGMVQNTNSLPDFESPEQLWRTMSRFSELGDEEHHAAYGMPDGLPTQDSFHCAMAENFSFVDSSNQEDATPAAHSLADLVRGSRVPVGVESSRQLPEPVVGTANPTRSTPLCSMATAGACTLGAACRHIHGNVCPHCKKACLHPLRPEEAADHVDICQRNQKKLETLRKSQDIECSVCLERVLSKVKPSERKFGILSHCDHPHCIGCIRGWRNTANQGEGTVLDVDGAIRACPVCRVQSHFVTPSVVWYFTPEEKEEIVQGYKCRLREIDCRHFNYGNGNCPFGTSCFYKHAYKDGRIEEVRLRHLGSADGSVVIARDVRLSDFITNANSRGRR